jgi:putative component of membrane protein insertase Oxa1/YidC/SpoIIIJ protein YidD
VIRPSDMKCYKHSGNDERLLGGIRTWRRHRSLEGRNSQRYSPNCFHRANVAVLSDNVGRGIKIALRQSWRCLETCTITPRDRLRIRPWASS